VTFIIYLTNERKGERLYICGTEASNGHILTYLGQYVKISSLGK
jgi:hypothetical protein